MAGGADVEVVGEIAGQVARSGVGQDQVALDGQQEAAPVTASCLGPNFEGAQGEPGPAPGGLGELAVAGGQALVEKMALAQADPDEDEGRRGTDSTAT